MALGGGVIGDLTGFAAAIVKRGLDFVQVPTSLLAQVDSSVGGKTAINSRAGKNLIGAFHQPRLVLADLDVLTSLPPREVMAGYAEIVKCALIGDAPFFDDLQQQAPRLIAGDLDTRASAITRAIRMKADIVAQDERESGPRALLNLGHTFGHAYEALCHYDSRLLHGEAVALGLNLAFGFSCHLGLCSPQDAQKVKRHLQELGFNIDPARVPGGPYDLDAVMTAMAQDKKIEGGRLTFILAHGIGRCFIAKDVSADSVRAYLAAPI
jgi:3-dehydroquinate synthase